jgi:hypothetical protein
MNKWNVGLIEEHQSASVKSGWFESFGNTSDHMHSAVCQAVGQLCGLRICHFVGHQCNADVNGSATSKCLPQNSRWKMRIRGCRVPTWALRITIVNGNASDAYQAHLVAPGLIWVPVAMWQVTTCTTCDLALNVADGNIWMQQSQVLMFARNLRGFQWEVRLGQAVKMLWITADWNAHAFRLEFPSSLVLM